MTKSELQLIVSNTAKTVGGNVLESLTAEMKKAANENNKIDFERLAPIIFSQSIQYSNEMLLNVLCEVLKLED